MRLSLAALVVSAVLAPATAHAFCRTTTNPVPATYNPTQGCFEQGLYLFWRNACVSYSLNQSASRSVPYDVAKRVMTEAFAAWQSVQCSDGNAPGIAVSDIGPASCSEVRYNSNSPNQNLIVFRDGSWPYHDQYSTLGLTTVTFNAQTGEIYDADMEINSSGQNLSYADNVPPSGFDLLSVLTHEAGHFLGLAHATDLSATMYASYRPGTDALRTLAPDDAAGICSIYPSARTRSVSASVSPTSTIEASACDATPRHGFTAQCSSQKQSSSSCSTGASKSEPSWAASASVLALLGSVLVGRRRRVHAGDTARSPR